MTQESYWETFHSLGTAKLRMDFYRFQHVTSESYEKKLTDAETWDLLGYKSLNV